MDYYMVEGMSPKDFESFQEWHTKQREDGVVFDFQKELVEYCISDVKLLKASCMQFRQLFESKTGFNPFSKVTIASACSHELRLNRMIKNSIASEPLHGWHVSVNQSVAALEWLHWQDYQLRTAALAQLTEEDLEAHDLMALAYADYEHPSHRHYSQHG